MLIWVEVDSRSGLDGSADEGVDQQQRRQPRTLDHRAQRGGVTWSSSPAITRVGVVMRGNSVRASYVTRASQQAA
jgi:hypothetical protein